MVNSLIKYKEEIITMSVKNPVAMLVPDGTLTNPERNTILAKTEKRYRKTQDQGELT